MKELQSHKLNPLTKPALPATASHGGALQRKCACGAAAGIGGGCEECDEKKLSIKRRASGGTDLSSVPPIVNDILGSAGQPLSHSTQDFMESRFGHDFSRVRVHTDSKAGESARAVNALAYTVGQHVVFGGGQFAPGTRTGDHLLAHELSHVVQQQNGTGLQPYSISSPNDPGEREADSAADQIAAGAVVRLSQTRRPQAIQRKVLDNVVTDFQPDPKKAKACIVHIHGEEQNALAVAKEMRKRRCVNLVHLDTKVRPITFEVTVGKDTHICKADPNRIFSEAGRETEAIKTCTLAGKETSQIGAVHGEAKKELKTFADTDFGTKIGGCRGGGAAPLDGTLPVVALHNNEGLSPASFKKVAEQGENLPQDPDDATKKLPNPSFNDPKHPNDFFLVTQKEEFLKLRDKHNVVLQANPLPKGGDDGSLSVALKDTHYVNVEKEGRTFALKSRGGFKYDTITYVENFALASDALDAVGATDGICSATDKVLSTDNPAADALGDVGAKQPAADAAEKTEAKQPAAEAAEKTEAKQPAQSSTDEKPVDREPVPEKPPEGCVVFKDQNALDARKTEWAKRLGKIPLREIVNWIVGGPDAPPAEATKEVEAQKQCLITAMRTGSKAKGLTIPSGKILKSELRTFEQQKGIWQRKFNFTGAEFDRISAFARKKCGSLIDAKDVKWNPKNKDHQVCWGTSKPPKGTTVTPLTSEEREKEILMASAAPGVSRHHAGTDFDFGRKDEDLEPEAWTGTGDFADAYRWLAKNASTWGFIQPFDTKGGYGKGYMAERWHWSYYPIAQALVEFAKAHQTDIDTELQSHWTDKGKVKEEFKFIAGHWRDYIFNVETKGRF